MLLKTCFWRLILYLLLLEIFDYKKKLSIKNTYLHFCDARTEADNRIDTLRADLSTDKMVFGLIHVF